jgi:hypothetical protein
MFYEFADDINAGVLGPDVTATVSGPKSRRTASQAPAGSVTG